MVEIDTPGSHWEVEFFADGTIETEQYVSKGVDAGPQTVEELHRLIANDEPV